MNRDELYKSDRGVGGYNVDELCNLPVSSQGFEDMLDKAAGLVNLPVDDFARIAVVSYLHHLPNDRMKIDLYEIARVIHVSYSRGITYLEGQFAKNRMDIAQQEERQKLQAEAESERKLQLVKDEPQQEGT